MTKDKALKLALEALEKHAELGLLAGATITAIREALADHIGDANKMVEVLREIGDLAHDNSTGPAVPDVLWEIRAMAYNAITERTTPKAQPEHSCVACEGNPKGNNNPCAVCGLAQPEQEPVAWMYQDKSTHEVRFQKHMKDFVDHSKTSEVPLYSEPLANHELQCVCGAVWCGDEMVHLPNKTTPPNRKPLSDEEIDAIYTGVLAVHHEIDSYVFARAIEAAHGIKGEA